jgi:hypothetical protein
MLGKSTEKVLDCNCKTDALRCLQQDAWAATVSELPDSADF